MEGFRKTGGLFAPAPSLGLLWLGFLRKLAQIVFLGFHLPENRNVRNGFLQFAKQLFSQILGAQNFAQILAQIFGAQIFLRRFGA